MELAVYSIDGTKTSKTVELNEEVFGAAPNNHAIYLDVKHHLANKRQGTHKTKERNEIKGSTRKLRRQKGTGAARIGDIKSPVLRGGGTIFGPKPRDHSFKLNKKVKVLARRSAVAYKVKGNNMLVLEDFSMEEPRTKKYLEILKSFELENRKSLLVLPDHDTNIRLASRNIPKASVITASQLNTYAIMHADRLLVFESSVALMEDFLKNK